MWGGYSKIRHALIGLAPYSLHNDLSKSTNLNFLMVHYLIAFNDLHNFHIPIDEYRKFFRAEYLASRLPLEPFDLNNPYYMKVPLSFMTRQTRLKSLKIRDGGGGKDFPETRNENIKILDEYLTFCERNNIRPIMFLPPMPEGYMKTYSKYRIDELRHFVMLACRKHPSAIFIDGWRLQGFNDRDFLDYGHMNIQGAAKFSAFLNSIIEQLDAGQ